MVQAGTGQCVVAPPHAMLCVRVRRSRRDEHDGRLSSRDMQNGPALSLPLKLKWTVVSDTPEQWKRSDSEKHFECYFYYLILFIAPKIIQITLIHNCKTDVAMSEVGFGQDQ
jgi:hypothetical protein